MAWYLGGVRIYVEKDSDWQVDPRLGMIDVLDSSQTIVHHAGRPSYLRSLTFVVFSGYQENILPLATGSGIPLVSDQGAQGNVIVKNFKADRILDISRITPVYRVTTELIYSSGLVEE